MKNENLKLTHKPLIETIFELRWELIKEVAVGIRVDPYYTMLIGMIYAKVQSEYPFHEALPSTMLSEEMAGHMVQHRFRKAEGEWPLIQIGPGIITLNATQEYTWKDFEKKTMTIINMLFETYPEADVNLRISEVLLRYINGIPFDFETSDIFDFVRDHMRTNIILDDAFFNGTGVGKLPLIFDSTFSFPSKRPAGAITLRFRRGKKETDALIWETVVRAVAQDAPTNSEALAKWLGEAHDLTHDWFLKLIAGELMERFK